jgi:hypothetical protein
LEEILVHKNFWTWDISGGLSYVRSKCST